MRRVLAQLLLTGAMIPFGEVLAHSEVIGIVTRIEKVYQAHDPIGQIRVTYDSTKGEQESFLEIDTDVFSVVLDHKALSDIPRPNWSAIGASYSTKSWNESVSEMIDEPYLIVSVPFYGPVGESWEGARIQYIIHADGSVNRQVRNSIFIKSGTWGNCCAHELSEDWPVGSETPLTQIYLPALEKIEKGAR